MAEADASIAGCCGWFQLSIHLGPILHAKIPFFEVYASIRLLQVGVSFVSSKFPPPNVADTERELSQIPLVLMCAVAVAHEGVVAVVATLHSTKMTLTSG